ncbi:MAG TPA: CHASE domain-containing protein [Lutibacter sp.]
MKNKKKWLSWLSLLVGLLVTLFLAWQIKSNIDKIAETEFKFETKKLSKKVVTRLHAHAQILQSSAAFLTVSDTITRKQWKDFIENSKILDNLPGIQGIGFALIIPENNLKEHILKIKGEGFSDYTVKPNYERENYTAVIYLEPLSDRVIHVFGYDMMTEPVRREAMERARDMNEVALSGKVSLLEGASPNAKVDYLIYTPVYQKDAVINSIEERRASIVGWVFSPYRMNDFMAGIMNEWDSRSDKRLFLHIYEGAENSHQTKLFESHKHSASENIRLSNQIPISFNEHQWLLKFHRPGNIIIDYIPVWIMLLGGIIISILLFFFIRSLINTNDKARLIANRLTTKLKEKEKYLTELQEIAGLGSYSYDLATGVWESSEILEKICGVNKGYIRSIEGWRTLTHPDYIEQIASYLNDIILNKKQFFSIEYKIIKHKSKEERWIHSFGKLVFDNLNNPIKIIGTISDITESKLAAEKLYLSREQYKNLFENSPLGIYQTKPDGTILKANPALLKMLEYGSLSELQKRNLKKEGYSDQSSVSRQQFVKMIEKDGFVNGLEEIWETQTGKNIPVREYARVMYGKNGEILFYEGTVEDITERKKAEDKILNLNKNLEVKVHERTLELQQTKNRLEYLLTSSPVVIYTSSAEPPFKATFIGDNVKQMVGYEAKQFLEDPNFWASKIHPDDVKQVFSEFPHLYEAGKYTNEYRFLLNDGTYAWMHNEFLIVKDRNGNPTELLGYWKDITKRKENEDKLHETLKEVTDYKIALNESSIVAITDHSGIIIYANDNFCKISQYERSELIGQDHRIVNSGFHPKEFFQDLWLTIGKGKTWKGEIRNKAKDGSFYWVATTIVPFLDSKGKPYQYVVIRTDITNRILIEEALIKSKEEADSANRAKSEFLANMSHEIRTPMNAVIGFSELLYNSVEGEKQRSQIKSIRNSGKTLLKIINDILDLSKIESGKLTLQKEVVNIHRLAKDMKMVFEHKTTEKNISFYIETESQIPAGLMLDETRIRQILFNLLGNAVKFTENGQVILILDKKDKASNTIDLIIKVEDTGIGISKVHQAEIFDAFNQPESQMNSKYGGTGLGLPITKRLTEIMGGKISVSSKPGKGSVFTVYLPDVEIVALENSNSDKITFDPTSVIFKEAKVLIVDNNKDNRNLIIDTFENSPLTIFEAENGEEAVKIATKNLPDLILMDIRMPVMDGYEAINILKNQKSTKSIPIIAISASIKIHSKTSELKKIFDDLLMKPIDLGDLTQLLKKYLAYQNATNKAVINKKEFKEISFELTEAQKKRLPELIQTLENEFIPVYNMVVKTQMIDHIEKFGNDLAVWAEKNDFKIILDYGNKISKLADNFEIDKLVKLLSKFPKIIEQHKSLINNN